MTKIIRGLFFISICLFVVAGCTATSRTTVPSDQPSRAAMPVPDIERPPVAEKQVEIKSVAPAPEPAMSGKPIGVSYSQLTNLITEFLDIQEVDATEGPVKFLGTSENNLISLEIVGQKDNISEASMRLVFPADMIPVNMDLNKAMMLRFLRNSIPEYEAWPAKIAEVMDKFHSLEKGSIQKDIMTFKERSIQILYDKNMDSITFILSHN